MRTPQRSKKSVVTARAAGHCRTCGKPITKGDRIRLIENKWHHARHPNGEAPIPTRLAKLTPTQRLSVAIATADEAAKKPALPARERRLMRLAAHEAAIHDQERRNLAFYGRQERIS